MNYPKISIIIIGRNEGERLIKCIQSAKNLDYPPNKKEIIYVDSCSSDNSIEQAIHMGVEKVFMLESNRTCAAMGRNKGLEYASGDLTLFLDGDTQVSSDFLLTAIPYFNNDEIAIVYGRRIEINPESLYIKLCGSDWGNRLPGFTDTSAGDILIRTSIIREIGGYKEIIAGEDPEMSNRVINAGYKILFLDKEMVKHDLAIYNFKQYWIHSVRSGFSYAVVSDLTKDRAVPLWVDKKRKMVFQGLLYTLAPIITLIVSLIMRTPLPLIICFFFGLIIIGRSFIKNQKNDIKGTFNIIYSLHSHFLKFPLLFGILVYHVNKNKSLIEYK